MALTDVFLSPSGAGDEDGSSVANALPVIEDGGGGDDWAPDFLALDRANKRFVFLTGTYNVQTKATFSGSAPSATHFKSQVKTGTPALLAFSIAGPIE